MSDHSLQLQSTDKFKVKVIRSLHSLDSQQQTLGWCCYEEVTSSKAKRTNLTPQLRVPFSQIRKVTFESEYKGKYAISSQILILFPSILVNN